jgi:hypothetical protein
MEQRVCILNMMTPDLYGSADPYQRVPRSPKRLNETSNEDRCRSPTSDQVGRTHYSQNSPHADLSVGDAHVYVCVLQD